MVTIGFIGLGNMGGPMAANLLKAGHAVKGYDLSADAITALEGRGKAASTIGEAVSGADAVVTMLPAGRHVKAVYLGEDGVLAQAAKGTLLIDPRPSMSPPRAKWPRRGRRRDGHGRRAGVGRCRRGVGGHAHLHGRRAG